MAPSLVEKYEQILAADPRSRIFVELAKALLEQGDHERVTAVCRQGLEHHPSSILGRVLWGRALLESGEASGALEQFERAAEIEPSSPYAFNLVGEALALKRLWREAVPYLTKALQLQPGDGRVRDWLAWARSEGADVAEEITRAIALTGSAAGSAPPGPIAAATAADTESADAPPTRRAPPLRKGEGEEKGATPPNGAVNSAVPPPPPLPSRTTPPPIRKQGAGGGPSVLSLIPGDSQAEHARGRARKPSAPTPDANEAALIAKRYEDELRSRHAAAESAAPKGFLHRHRRAVAILALLFAGAGGAAAYWGVRLHGREKLADRAAGLAEAGLARGTLASLRAASEVLDEARAARPDDLRIASFAAQVSALLAADYGDEKARETAADLSDPRRAGDGALVSRLLLARGGSERRDAEKAVLSAKTDAPPLVHALAGEALLARGDAKGARERLERARKANPPLLRALADLGDAEARSGDPESALAWYTAAIQAHATHARSVVGAAEARLALGRDLETSRRELAAIDADPGSLPPISLRLRFELASARVLAALGDPAAAAQRLSRAGERLGRSAALSGALAEIHLAAHAYDRAEPEAARAVDQEPKETDWKVLLARARNGRGRYAEALEATEGADGRAVRIQRAIARYGLGQYGRAKDELEKLARGGKMPAEAAVWYGLCEVASGRAAKARPMLEKLAAAKTATALAVVALGKAQEAEGDPAGAEETYRAAVAKDPSAADGHAALGRLLLADGRAKEAIAPLERAAKIDPFLYDARLALAEAHLASGAPGPARAELDMILLGRPRDAAALRALSTAHLAERHAAEARSAAERAVSADRSAASYLALARASLAAKDVPGAKRAASEATRLARTAPEADEARLIAAAATKRRK